MPPAVLRRSRRSEAEDPHHGEKQGGAERRAQTPGCEKAIWMCRPERIDWPAKKTMSTAGRLTAARRREDERLGPEDRQALGDCGEGRADHPGRVLGGDREDAEDPDRDLGEGRWRGHASGWKRAGPPAQVQASGLGTVPARMPMPTSGASVASSDQRVERSERSFVHSEMATRALGDAADGRRGRLRRSCQRLFRPAATSGLSAWNSTASPGELHERLLERRLLRRQLVEHDAVGGGGRADLLRRQDR